MNEMLGGPQRPPTEETTTPPPKKQPVEKEPEPPKTTGVDSMTKPEPETTGVDSTAESEPETTGVDSMTKPETETTGVDSTAEPVPVPVPVPVPNPVFSFLQQKDDDVLRIEKIEVGEPTEATEEYDETNLLESEEKEYVVFRIYSPYYEIYESLFTSDYLRSIGLTTQQGDGMSGGGEPEATFPYSLFKSLFNNTLGRFGYLFQPKKEDLAEEKLKQGDTLLARVGHFETKDLLKPIEETSVTEETAPEEPAREFPPYYEIKIPKSGPVLSEEEYRERKLRETNDDILEHDENGNTFQEILLETQQDEIQQARKQTLLTILDVPLPPDRNGIQPKNVVDKIKALEEKYASDKKVWFIRQQVVLDDLQPPTYKWVKLNLGIVYTF